MAEGFDSGKTGAQVVDALNKAHNQNTDTALDQGGANEITAEQIKQRTIDPTGEPADQVAATGGDGNFGLVQRFGPDDLSDQANHLRSIVAPMVFPGFGSGLDLQPALFWGPPGAPISGQETSAPIGPFSFVFPATFNTLSTRPGLEVCGAYRLRGELGTALDINFGLAIDADNWYEVNINREQVTINQSVDGTVSQVDAIPHSGSLSLISDSNGAFRWAFGRRASNRSALWCSDGSWDRILLPLVPFDYTAANFICFGRNASRSRFLHAVVYGQCLESVGSLP